MADENFFQFIWHNAKWMYFAALAALLLMLGADLYDLIVNHSWDATIAGLVCMAPGAVIGFVAARLKGA